MSDKLGERIEKFKFPIALSVLGLVLLAGGVFINQADKSKSLSAKDFPKNSLVDQTKMISVDVSGAVSSPGVYKLSDGSRIEDAIYAAGGFSQDSNTEYISKYLNMAQKLSDGSKVYVPLSGEMMTTPAQAGGAGGVVAGAQSKVNINSASQVEIEALPGIGPATALKIIQARPYQQIEDLLSKKSVSKAVFEKIKDLVSTY